MNASTHAPETCICDEVGVEIVEVAITLRAGWHAVGAELGLGSEAVDAMTPEELAAEVRHRVHPERVGDWPAQGTAVSPLAVLGTARRCLTPAEYRCLGAICREAVWDYGVAEHEARCLQMGFDPSRVWSVPDALVILAATAGEREQMLSVWAERGIAVLVDGVSACPTPVLFIFAASMAEGLGGGDNRPTAPPFDTGVGADE